MPKNSMWPHSVRRKYIHSVGVHGKVKFMTTDVESGYGGFFKGADYGVIRLSSAAKPVVGGQPLAPGLGLKFLRNGEDSSNLVAMYSVEGTPKDWNFFSKDFTNHIGPSQSTALKVLAAKFATETKYIQQVGLSDMAHSLSSMDEMDGSENKDAFPFSLRFEPHKDVHNLFPTDLPGSDPMVYVSQLESVPAGSGLYNVYATNAPGELNGEEHLIGSLVLDGKLVKSKWGDENLFFRHQMMNDDVKIHPEWDPYLDKFKFGGCPFMSNWLGK